VREDPIISGGLVKAALILLAAGVLGVGAYLIVSGVNIDLPDIEDSGGSTTVAATTSADATVARTQTQHSTTPAAASDPFSSAGFGSALARVRAAVGPNRQLTRVSVNDVQTQFSVRRGSGIEAYSVRADSGDVVRQSATITITGNATIDDFAFALDGLKASAIDRMLSAARKVSGTGDFRPTVLNLERRIPFGSRELAWTISAEGGGRNLTYRAAADGGDVRDIGGGGTPIPPQIQQAQELNRCIQAAGSDVDQITACLDRLSGR
jgi:hypothetical protein